MTTAADIWQATLTNGGYTDPSVTGRYVVAQAEHGQQVTVSDEQTAIEAVTAYMAAHHVIGTWLNEGTLYLDAPVGYDDMDEALTVARATGELAIWDAVARAEVWTRES